MRPAAGREGDRAGKPGRSTMVAGGAWLAALLCAGSASGAGLASAPIDRSLFRDGEVTNTNSVHGRWSLACDEVLRLRLRYCTLRAPVLDEHGSVVARLTVSTGDDGKPAALIEVPLGIKLSTGLSIEPGPSPAPSAKGRRADPNGRRGHVLQIAECDRRACYAVWTLRPDELQVLNAGGPLQVAYGAIAVVDPLAGDLSSSLPRAVRGAIPTGDFSAAVSASIR